MENENIEISEKTFRKYLKLQEKGDYNMMSPQVRIKLGLTREEHQYLMFNYEKIAKQYDIEV